MGDSWWSRMPRAPLHPHGCLSWRFGRHSHPSLLKGSLLGCLKVGLNEAKPGVLRSPQRAPGQHTSPAHPDPTIAAHPRGPRHCHQGISGATSQARGWWTRLLAILCVHPNWLMVQQELWGACVHGRDTQDGFQARLSQEAADPRWEDWVGLLTTTGDWSTSLLCPQLPQL